MFYTDPIAWTAALSAQRYYWYENKNTSGREMCRLISEQPKLGKEIWEIAGKFKVARNFPDDVRRRSLNVLRKAEVADFDSFVAQVRECSRKIQKLPRKTKSGRKTRERRYYAISGVSKILWHRFPSLGFVFDDQARRALAMNGLTAPFFNNLNAWGGAPHEELRGDFEFIAFAAAYRHYGVGMCDAIRTYMKVRGDLPKLKGDITIQANQVFDKLLWLSGEEHKKRDHKIGNWFNSATKVERAAGVALARAADQLLRKTSF